ncbi:MAG TPA: tail fiber protein [Pseudolabrys sp.]|jgi:microcystin-dependent protein|nr:tail fiber protein [Pseudolabrys sp.]
MTQPYVGEIRMFGGNFAPRGWMLCNGQLLAIAQYNALFALLGTTYGGNGTTNFALPNLQSRISVGQGNGAGLTPRTLGETGGQETVTLAMTQMPPHMHGLNASLTAAASGGQTPGSTVILGTPNGSGELYVVDDGSQPPPTVEVLPSASCSQAGGSQPHENIMPVLCVTYIIAINGIFPSRN